MPIPPKPRCLYHAEKTGPYQILVEGGGVINVCEQCRYELLKPKYPLFICKFCGIPIKSPADPSPAGRKPHKPGYYAAGGNGGNTWKNGCPRSENYRDPGEAPEGSAEEALDWEDSDR